MYGDTKNSKWYYYKHSKRYEIYSPLKQNQKHVEYLRAFLKGFGEVPCFSVVTMICDDFKISGENNKNTAICNSLPAMERALYKIAEGNPQIWEKDKKQEIRNYIQNNQHIGAKAREEHKEDVTFYKKSLQEMEDRKACPRCKTELILRNGKYSAFYGCGNYPRCKYTLAVQDSDKVQKNG